jgi:hypothetical protein
MIKADLEDRTLDWRRVRRGAVDIGALRPQGFGERLVAMGEWSGSDTFE